MKYKPVAVMSVVLTITGTLNSAMLSPKWVTQILTAITSSLTLNCRVWSPIITTRGKKKYSIWYWLTTAPRYCYYYQISYQFYTPISALSNKSPLCISCYVCPFLSNRFTTVCFTKLSHSLLDLVPGKRNLTFCFACALLTCMYMWLGDSKLHGSGIHFLWICM